MRIVLEGVLLASGAAEEGLAHLLETATRTRRKQRASNRQVDCDPDEITTPALDNRHDRN